MQAGGDKAIQLTKIRVTFSGLSDQPLPHKTPATFAHLTNQPEPGTPPAYQPRCRLSGVKAPSPLRPTQPHSQSSTRLQPPTKKPAASRSPTQQASAGQTHQDPSVSAKSNLGQPMQTAFGQAAIAGATDIADSAVAAAATDGMQRPASSAQPPFEVAVAAAAAPEHQTSPRKSPGDGAHLAGQPSQRMQLTIRSASQIQLQRGGRRAMSGSLVEGGVVGSPMWSRNRAMADVGLQDHARRAALAAADEAEVAASQAAALAVVSDADTAGQQYSLQPSSPLQSKLPEPWRSPMSRLACRPSSIAGV
ncbi:hypothetical protein WJX74_003720 [Apatococcus lobatus]|uniref:Uncharacterized protein n=1 Tax=Apatococcus lobatus TaxID=904363 RepID=A0AAW1RPQ6_9CHLO